MVASAKKIKNISLKNLKRTDVEHNAAFVIKLALPRNPQGYRPGYAGNEYKSFFAALKVEYGAEYAGLVDTKSEGKRDAYAFSGEKIELGKNIQVVAVAHETGLEILFIVIAAKALTGGAAAGVAAGIAKAVGIKAGTAGVVAFSKWVWKKWEQSRPANRPKGDLSLVMRKIEERLPDGTIRKSVESEVYGPLDEKQVAKQFRTFLRATS